MLLGARTAAMTSNGDDDMLLLSQLVDGSIAGDLVLSSTKIKTTSFYGCVNITSVVANSALSIEYNSFQNCTNLTRVEIPNATSAIPTGVFQNDGKLRYIDVRSATYISMNAFVTVSNAEIHIEGATSFHSYAFNGMSGASNIHVGYTCDGIMAVEEFPFMATTSSRFTCTDGYVVYESGAWKPHYNAA